MQFWHDKARNILIYPQAAPFLLQAIPEARSVNGTLMAVPRTLRNCQVLRKYDFPVPPVMENYDWPIEPGRKPLQHQKLYANFTVLHPKMFNLGDPGTMKTLSTLWAFDWLRRQHPGEEFRALVVAPLTILETVWASAIFKNFLSGMTCEILTGDAGRRTRFLARKADVYIINHDGVAVGAHTRKFIKLDGLSKELAEREDIKVVIIDEARAYGDARTKRNRIGRLVFGHKPYLWQLTGTPMPNAPTDAYGMAKLANNAYGKSFDAFQKETMINVSKFKWVPRREGYEVARRLLTPAVRVPITAVWDGPPRTTQQRRVALTAEQVKLMAELKRDLQLTVASGVPITAANEAAARWKFIQISLGAVYDDAHKAHLVDAKPRYEEVASIIESTERKVIVFVPITSVIDMLAIYLRKRWKIGVINGEVGIKERATLIRAFVDEPDFKVMVVDPGTTAHGINEFVEADTAIWMGATDKAELWIQGNARIDRPGQRYPTTVFQLVSNKLEEEIFRRLETNTSMQGLMLEAVARGDL